MFKLSGLNCASVQFRKDYMYFVCFVEVWKVRNLKESSFGTLERPDNLNIAGEYYDVGDEGADDEHHLVNI